MSNQRNDYNGSSRKQGYGRQGYNSWNNGSFQDSNMPYQSSSQHGLYSGYPPNAPFQHGIPSLLGYQINQQSFNYQYNSNNLSSFGPQFQHPTMSFRTYNMKYTLANPVSNSNWTKDNWCIGDSMKNSSTNKQNWQIQHNDDSNLSYDSNISKSRSKWTETDWQKNDEKQFHNKSAMAECSKSNSGLDDQASSSKLWTEHQKKYVATTNLDSIKGASSSNWTKDIWHKGENYVKGHNDSNDDDEANHKSQKVVQQNIKKVPQGLLKPVVAVKAERMMQMMGWKGGALGAKGNGITEPIIPNINQAKGAGLGHKVPESQSRTDMKSEEYLKPVASETAERMEGRQNGELRADSIWILEPIMPNINQVKGAGLGKMKPPKQRAKNKPQNTALANPEKLQAQKLNRTKNSHKTARKIKIKVKCIDFLYEILDFVNDKTKTNLVFDSSLSNKQRLAIHQAVNYVMNELDMLIDYDQFELEVLDDIIKCNSFVLYSESIGKTPNRKLHLWKEAPKHMYLITPDDLNENYVHDDDVQIIIDDAEGNEETAKKSNESQENCEIVRELDRTNTKLLSENNSSIVKNLNNVIGLKWDIRGGENEENIDSDNYLRNNELKESAIEKIAEKLYIQRECNTEKISDKNTNTGNKEIAEENNKIQTKGEQKNKQGKIRKVLYSYFLDFFNDKEFTEMRFLGDFDDLEIIVGSFIHNVSNSVLNPVFAENIVYEGFKEIFLSDVKLDIGKGFDEGVVISKVNEDEILTNNPPIY